MAKKRNTNRDKVPATDNKSRVNILNGGMQRDTTVLTQGQEDTIFMLNGTEENSQGDLNSVSNYPGNEMCAHLPEEFIVLGKQYMTNGEISVIGKDTSTDEDVIGIFDTNKCEYIEHERLDLNLDINHQIDIAYRLRMGCERTIYFTDNYNVPRYYNYDRPEIFKDSDGNFDVTLLSLLYNRYEIPKFQSIEVKELGKLKPGAVVIGVQYVDNDENLSHVVTMSKKVEIYNPKITKTFENIHGTSSVEDSLNNNPETTKAIEIVLSDLDNRYSFYRLVFVHYTKGSNTIEKVYTTQNIPIEKTEYLYTGYDTLYELDPNSIQADPVYISRAKSVSIYDDRLILSNVVENDFNFCSLQKYASKIKSNCVTKEVDVYDITDPACPKKPNHETGYMPGDIYSFGIVYLFDNGVRSPVYHIPGKNPKDLSTNMINNNISKNNTYDTIQRNGCEENDFWGIDAYGESLTNKPVRHHRFPTRKQLGKPLIFSAEDTSVTTGPRTLKPNAALVSNVGCGEENTIQWLWSMGEGLEAIRLTVVLQSGENIVEFSATQTEDLFYSHASDINFVTLFTKEIVIPEEYANYTILHYKYEYKNSEGGGFRTLNVNGENVVYADITKKRLHNNNNIDDGTLPLVCFNFSMKVEDTQEVNNSTYRQKYNILGVKFSNIEIPDVTMSDGSKIIGYEIVRQERTYKDRNILDTGFITPSCKNEHYYTVGTWNTNYGDGPASFDAFKRTDEELVFKGAQKLTDFDSGLVNSVYGFWNPLFQYKAEEFEITKIKTVGAFSRTKNRLTPIGASKIFSKDYQIINYTEQGMTFSSPSLHTKDNAVPTDKDLKYSRERIEQKNLGDWTTPGYNLLLDVTEDVREGTTYDPKIDENSDKDGFRLRYLTRESNVGFEKNFTAPDIAVKDMKYLNAISSYEAVTDSQISNKTIFNVTADSKMGYVIPEHNVYTLNQLYYNIPYVELRTDVQDWYTNFREDIYFKETNNYFDASMSTTPEIYSGDIHLGEVRPHHSIYYNTVAASRKKKRKIFDIFLGAIVSVASIVGAFFTGGYSLVALPVGLSYLKKGIQWEKMLSAYKNDWDNGVRTAFADNNYLKQDGDSVEGTLSGWRKFNDDEIRYMIDGVNTLYYETTINTYLDYSIKDEVPAKPTYKTNLLAVQDYGLTKLTAFDFEKNESRGLRPVPYPEIYQVNPDYYHSNYGKFKHPIPYTYDCCSDCLEKFPHRNYYSERGFQEDLIDMFKQFKPNNYKDITGETGVIVNTFVLQNKLFYHTEEALWMQQPNYQERVMDNIVSIIGTGAFLEIPPQKIINDESGNSCGLQHKWSATLFPNGYIFISENQKKPFLFDGKLTDLTKFGYAQWFYDHIEIQNKDMVQDSPASPNGTGFITCYYPREEKIFITKKDGEYSWTISFALKKQRWRSFHSFIPSTYLTAYDELYTWQTGTEGLWHHLTDRNYQTYYGTKYPFIVEYVAVKNMFTNTVYDYFRMHTEAYILKDGVAMPAKNVTFDEAIFTTDTSSTGVVSLIVPDLEDIDYFDIQSKDDGPKTITLNKKETDWYFNELRNYRVDYTEPIFVKTKKDPIVDLHNNRIIDYNKDWQDVDMLRGKYLRVRLIFENPKDYKLVKHFIDLRMSHTIR